MGKNKKLSTRYLLCRKFAAVRILSEICRVCRKKMQLFARRSTFFYLTAPLVRSVVSRCPWTGRSIWRHATVPLRPDNDQSHAGISVQIERARIRPPTDRRKRDLTIALGNPSRLVIIRLRYFVQQRR